MGMEDANLGGDAYDVMQDEVDTEDQAAPEKEKPAPGSREEYAETIRESKERAQELMGEIAAMRESLSVFGANGVTVEQPYGDMNAAPEVRLNKVDMSEPTFEETQAVEDLKDLLGRAGGIVTRFSNQQYSDRASGHNLRLMWMNGPLNTNPAHLLEDVESQLSTTVEHDFGY